MKKISFFIVLVLTALYSHSTNVTGGIYSNTVWTLTNSPYVVTDTVMVFPGVTLTIQPGVVVKFNSNGLIDIRGGLIAHGTSSDSIIFTSNLISPAAGDYNGILIDTSTSPVTYCRVSYAQNGLSAYSNNYVAHCMFSSDINGINGGTIDTCIFKYDTIASNRVITLVQGCSFFYNGTAINDANNIENCIIEYNTNGIANGIARLVENCTIMYNTSYGILNLNNCEISNNIIEYNNVGINSSMDAITYNNISHNYIGIETSGGIDMVDTIGIICNSFCDNSDYNFILTEANNLSIANNYWCLTDSAQIQATIYDGYQKLTLGLAFFTPFLDTACSSVPTAVKNISIDSVQKTSVFPNPSNGIFTIQCSGRSSKESVEIYNVLGERIYPTPPLTALLVQGDGYTEINISNQSNGVYFYRVIDETGVLLGSGKFIIQK